MRAPTGWKTGLLLSALVHASVVGFVTLGAPARPSEIVLAAQASASATAAATEIALLPSPSAPSVAPTPSARGDAGVRVHTQTERAELGGAHSAQNIDTERRGEGGDGASRERGRLLAERSAGVNLSPHTLNTLRADQEHRLRTSPVRESPQQVRSTPNAGYDPWIASTHGVLLFRLPDAERLPAVGARVSDGRAVAEGTRHDESREPVNAPSERVEERGTDARVARAQQATVAGARERPTAGVARGVDGHAARVAGPAAFGRASIEQGHASTTAPREAARPRDDVDAEALATTLMRNALAASVQSGPREDDGRGGAGGGGDPGAGGGVGAGGRARPFGEGEGWVSLDAPDARYLRYFQQLRRSIDPLWENAFPRDEMLQLRQGTVIVRFVVGADGRVHGVRVTRRSGVDRFDQNVASALEGARLPPIPAELQRNELRISAPFVFRNPIVR